MSDNNWDLTKLDESIKKDEQDKDTYLSRLVEAMVSSCIEMLLVMTPEEKRIQALEVFKRRAVSGADVLLVMFKGKEKEEGDQDNGI